MRLRADPTKFQEQRLMPKPGFFLVMMEKVGGLQENTLKVSGLKPATEIVILPVPSEQ